VVVEPSEPLSSQQAAEDAELNTLALGALLHDLGKTAIDTKILQKPRALTSDEWRVVKQHPKVGVELLERSDPLPQGARCVVLQHHEKCDGTGYPRGLLGKDIHQHAKIACLADVFDALTTDRPYARGVTGYEAFRVMRGDFRGSFDPRLWRQFVQLLAGE